MHEHRPLSPIEDLEPTIRESGHFWIQEYVLGGLLRFEMAGSGMLRFGDNENVFEPQAIPPHYRPAVAAVREQLDRDRLRGGVDDVGAFTFLGVAPLGRGMEYDWDTIPAFLGHDIWDGTADSFATDDVVERVFETIGLSSVPTLEKEVPATHLDLARDAFPASRWAPSDVPALVVRKKSGAIARVDNPNWDRTAPNDAGIDGVARLESWLEERLTPESLPHLVPGELDSVWDRSIEELAADAAGELARREFGTVGRQVRTHPAQFETAVRSRITAIHRDRFE